MEERIAKLGEVVETLSPQVVGKIGPLEITSTIIAAWLVMAILFIFVFWLTRGLRERDPGRRQLFSESVMGFLYGMLDELTGKEGRPYIYLTGSLFIFVLALNLSWLIPELLPATTDLSVTLALGVVTVLTVQFIGIQRKGLKAYLKHYVQPTPFMLPMNIIEELVKPLSLGLRLFGNMFGEEMVVLILFILIPVIIPVPIQLLGVLMGSVQAYVFALLSTLYVAGMLEE